MKTIWSFGLAAVAALVAAPAGARDIGTLTVTSPAFVANGPIPQEYSCEGRSVSPPLQWSSVPPETRSIAVIVDDPDAPGGTYEHLVQFNLPPTTRALPSQSAGTPPSGTLGMAALNSSGTSGFAPICPPRGATPHHYRFQVLALDQMLNLPATARSSDVARALGGHILARGEIVGTYQKR